MLIISKKASLQSSIIKETDIKLSGKCLWNLAQKNTPICLDDHRQTNGGVISNKLVSIKLAGIDAKGSGINTNTDEHQAVDGRGANRQPLVGKQCGDLP